LSFFFDPPAALAESSLAELTTDHPPAAVLEVEWAGATGWAGESGSAGFGAGVHEGSLGAGLGVGSGAGRKGSAGWATG